MRRRALLATPLISVPAYAATLEPFGRGSWAALRAEAAGQPMIVHFWALSCAPCLVELPHWSALARRNPGLRLVLVNTDPPDQAPQVIRTLDRAGLSRARNLAFTERFAARLRYEVDPEWQGELPRTDLVARDGQVEPVIGALDLKRLEAWAKAQASADLAPGVRPPRM